MRFDNTEDDEREDFFEETPPPKPKEPKEPDIPPEDPRFWEKEEDAWGHLRLSNLKSKLGLIVILITIVIVAIWSLSIWLFGTSAEQQVRYGYVESVELRGTMIKTYEGVLLPYKAIHDTTRVYNEDFTFSLSDRDGKILQTFRDSGKPVKVTYKTYHTIMPWRGECKRVVERIDTVDVRTILPAEFDSNPRR